MLRIPQWAARAKYFKKDVKVKALWILLLSFGEIAKPGLPGIPGAPAIGGAAGADIYPYPMTGLQTVASSTSPISISRTVWSDKTSSTMRYGLISACRRIPG